MNKAKLSSFAIAGVIGLASLSPITTLAADTKTEATTQTEMKADCKDKKAEFEKKLKVASEKWSSLNQTQKNEVYTLLENKVKESNKVLDKLVELKVLDQSDAENMKTRNTEKYQKMKESGEFPLLRGKGSDKNQTR